jgi:Ca2+-binding EF-hand superfamily protein
MAKEELEYLLSDMFKQADTDGSGVLSRQQFSTCLRNTELGLSRKEINALMGEADSNHDGVVSYDEVRDRERERDVPWYTLCNIHVIYNKQCKRLMCTLNDK